MVTVSPNNCNKKPEIGKEFQGTEERMCINKTWMDYIYLVAT